MNDAIVVRVEGLGKRFKLYTSARARLADWLGIPPRPRYREFWALRDLSWEVRRGECLGIIGPNGAGKTTLLKLLTGALYPTLGSLYVQGRVLSLLELGTGFNPDLTGRENVELSATLMGFPSGYAAAHLEEIEVFAELGDYFHRPVKFYSTGMLVRLAFSVFSTMEPDVFLVDEALAVGDLRFASRALGRVRKMLDAGTTLLFVSHDLHLINRMCTRAIWLHAGTVQMDGDPVSVTRAYQQFVVHGGLQALQTDLDGEPDLVEPQPALDNSAATSPELDIAVGDGWCPLEAYAGEVFRWAERAAEIIVERSGATDPELLLDLEPGPGAGAIPAHLNVTDARGARLAHVELTGRQVVQVRVPRQLSGEPERLFLRLPGLGQPAPGDGRQLLVRIFGWAWSDRPTLRSIQQAREWEDTLRDLDLAYELVSMRAALRRCTPVPGGSVHFARVVTLDEEGDDAVRFSMHDRVMLRLTLEAVADVDGLIVGVQLRDAFDRMITGTRTDWQRSSLPALLAGQRMTVDFSCPDMLLGPGLYQFTVAVSRDGREDAISHWVDGAWRFEVISSGEAFVAGLVDMRWRYERASTYTDDDVADLLPVRSR